MPDVKPRPVSGPARSGPHAGLSIAEAARRTGVSVHTLRYYERAGLAVTPVGRTGGRRRYQPEDLNWITVCTRLRATGMPIKAIRRYAQLVSAGPGTERERLALLQAHRADVTAKLAELQETSSSSTTRSTSTEVGSPPATPANYGRPAAQRVPAEQSRPRGGERAVGGKRGLLAPAYRCTSGRVHRAMAGTAARR